MPRHSRQIFHALRRIVHVHTVMAHPIAHNQIWRTQHTVVGSNLLEHLLRDGHLGGLVFDNHQRKTARLRIDHRIAAPRHTPHTHLHLVGHQTGGIAQMLHEIMREMLAHPFLGSQCDEAAAQEVVNLRAAPFPFHFYVEVWQIDWNHFLIFAVTTQTATSWRGRSFRADSRPTKLRNL